MFDRQDCQRTSREYPHISDAQACLAPPKEQAINVLRTTRDKLFLIIVPPKRGEQTVYYNITRIKQLHNITHIKRYHNITHIKRVTYYTHHAVSRYYAY